MFDYLWWLLPNFFKKSVKDTSIIRGLVQVFADAISSIKQNTLKARLSHFISKAETTTDYYETETSDNLLSHGEDKLLPQKENETIEEYRQRLLDDPNYRILLGTKAGIKHYLEHFIPEIRVDFIYEISADDKKWIVLSIYDQQREAKFNLSHLFNSDDLLLEEHSSLRNLRLYSTEDLNLPEFLFWVKVYNRIKEDGVFTVYPEKILEKIDRLKPAHTKGHLAFNLIDNEFTNLVNGQVIIGENITVEGRTVLPPAIA